MEKIDASQAAGMFLVIIGVICLIGLVILLGPWLRSCQRRSKRQEAERERLKTACAKGAKEGEKLEPSPRLLSHPAPDDLDLVRRLALRHPVSMGWVLDHYWVVIQQMLLSGKAPEEVYQQVSQEIAVQQGQGSPVSWIVVSGGKKGKFN